MSAEQRRLPLQASMFLPATRHGCLESLLMFHPVETKDEGSPTTVKPQTKRDFSGGSTGIHWYPGCGTWHKSSHQGVWRPDWSKIKHIDHRTARGFSPPEMP